MHDNSAARGGRAYPRAASSKPHPPDVPSPPPSLYARPRSPLHCSPIHHNAPLPPSSKKNPPTWRNHSPAARSIPAVPTPPQSTTNKSPRSKRSQKAILWPAIGRLESEREARLTGEDGLEKAAERGTNRSAPHSSSFVILIVTQFGTSIPRPICSISHGAMIIDSHPGFHFPHSQFTLHTCSFPTNVEYGVSLIRSP